MDELQKLLSDAGLPKLLKGGRVAPHKIIGALMAKNKETGYNRPGVKPFDARKLNNPSPFIQKKYLDGDIKPFDYCKAQQRRQQQEEEPEWKQYEYWGLTKDDFVNGVNRDGLSFPPFEWKSPWNNKTYVGLAKHEPGEKRLTMMYFKDFPDKQGLPDNITFSETQAREQGIKDLDVNTDQKLKSLNKEDELTYNGITLKGTNRVLIRNYVKKRKDAGKKRSEKTPVVLVKEEEKLIPPPKPTTIKKQPIIEEEEVKTVPIPKKKRPVVVQEETVAPQPTSKDKEEAQRFITRAREIPLKELFKLVKLSRAPQEWRRQFMNKKALEIVKQRFNSITEDDVMGFEKTDDDGYARNILRMKKEIVNKEVQSLIEGNKDNKKFNL